MKHDLRVKRLEVEQLTKLKKEFEDKNNSSTQATEELNELLEDLKMEYMVHKKDSEEKITSQQKKLDAAESSLKLNKKALAQAKEKGGASETKLSD